jgi:hypothetical protein
VTVADAAESCSCGAPTLLGLDPQQVAAGQAVAITATMTNAPSQFYQLVLTPSGGGQELVFFCDSFAANSCEANVTVQAAGNYNAAIRTGQAPNTYDTNVVQQALSVSAPPACVHSECLPGARLGSTCSSCATAVCNSIASCCTTEWGASCVDAAAASGSCGCTPPAIVGLSESAITEDSATTITVTMTGAPSGTYNLVLTPSGGGAEQTFVCDWTGSNVCEASVNIATPGDYDATIRVGDPQTWDTNTLSSALTVNAASSGNGSLCIPSENQIVPTGAGTCADPYFVDLSGLTNGGTAWVEIPAGNANDEVNGDLVDTCLADTARDIALTVNLPGTMVLQIAAETAEGDPIVSVKPDNFCGEPALACSDAATAGTCYQYIEDVSPPSFQGINVIVSETVNTGNSIIVTFSII